MEEKNRKTRHLYLVYDDDFKNYQIIYRDVVFASTNNSDDAITLLDYFDEKLSKHPPSNLRDRTIRRWAEKYCADLPKHSHNRHIVHIAGEPVSLSMREPKLPVQE